MAKTLMTGTELTKFFNTTEEQLRAMTYKERVQMLDDCRVIMQECYIKRGRGVYRQSASDNAYDLYLRVLGVQDEICTLEVLKGQDDMNQRDL